MANARPVILLIPGAWHRASTFEPVASILRARGHQAKTVTLPSAGGSASTTAYDDAKHIQDTYLSGLVAQGQEVILAMHSYAGIPGTESVKGFARKDLAVQGKKGGVIGLIYQSAFLVPAGASVESFLPGGLDRFMTIDGDKMYPKAPRQQFYNDFDDETASKHLANLVHHAPETMRTPLTYEAYRHVPVNFIFSTKDAGFPLIAQQKIAGILGESVVGTYSINAGHLAMLSQPQAVADAIHDVATKAAGF